MSRRLLSVVVLHFLEHVLVMGTTQYPRLRICIIAKNVLCFVNAREELIKCKECQDVRSIGFWLLTSQSS